MVSRRRRYGHLRYSEYTCAPFPLCRAHTRISTQAHLHVLLLTLLFVVSAQHTRTHMNSAREALVGVDVCMRLLVYTLDFSIAPIISARALSAASLEDSRITKFSGNPSSSSVKSLKADHTRIFSPCLCFVTFMPFMR